MSNKSTNGGGQLESERGKKRKSEKYVSEMW